MAVLFFMDKKAIVFIDGNNFYYKLKELRAKLCKEYSLLDFDYRKFSEWLVGENKLVDIRYYIGAIKRENNNQKSEELYSGQQKLIAKLQQHRVTITLGQIIRHPDGTRHEKGVDVRLAVEMIRLARQDKYDIAYLLSSDTDLVPVVEEVREFSKEVQYVGIPKGQSFGLSIASNDVRLLRPEEVEQFFPEILV